MSILSISLLFILKFIVGDDYVRSGDTLTKILLPQGAQCLDGSPAGFYYGLPSSENSSLWVFFMEGGGACWTKDDCIARSKTDLGSSLNWPDTMKSDAVLSNDPAINPDFYDAYRIYIPYCTGDIHSGQRVNATEQTWGLYFSGHVNFVRIIDLILEDQTYGPALKNAKQVLLSGSSAGGLGAFYNVDYLADRLPWATVKGAPICGWLFPGYAEDQPDQPYATPSSWPNWNQGKVGSDFDTDQLVVLWDIFLNKDCVHNFTSDINYMCYSVHNFYSFIKSSLFIMQNQFDTNQIHEELLLPWDQDFLPKHREYIAYFGRSLRNSTERKLSLKPEDGLFLASCYDHGEGLGVGGTTIVRGYNQTALLGDWFFQHRKFGSHQIIDNCVMKKPGLPCNPTCDNV